MNIKPGPQTDRTMKIEVSLYFRRSSECAMWFPTLPQSLSRLSYADTMQEPLFSTLRPTPSSQPRVRAAALPEASERIPETIQHPDDRK